jgi:hypothetical protein
MNDARKTGIELASHKILSYLFDRYYSNPVTSNAVSSHWRRYGEFQMVARVDGGFWLSGVGFGDYKRSRLEKIIPSFLRPVDLYVKGMLGRVDERLLEAGKWFAHQNSFTVGHDLARQLLTIDLLARLIKDFEGKRICIIGDGYGVLGSILKRRFPSVSVTFINLGRTLFFDAFYSLKCFPAARVIGPQDSLDEAARADFRYVEAEEIDIKKIEADVFINIASMQEMDLPVINRYFNIIRGQGEAVYFYCCNRVSKTLPDGSVINFEEYGWRDSDEVLIDELCPWHQCFPTNRPPFVKSFDGPTRHRLIRVAGKGAL